MKIQTLLVAVILTLSSTASAGVSLANINKGVLVNDPFVRFRGGASMVRLSDGDFFKMQGFGDRVEFQSVSTKDWFFDDKVIYMNELSIANVANIEQSDIHTITATALHNGGQEYAVHVIKQFEGGALGIRVIAVDAIPEPEAIALLFGLGSLTFVALRKRK